MNTEIPNYYQLRVGELCPIESCCSTQDGPYPVVVEVVDEFAQRWWRGPGPRDFGVVYPKGNPHDARAYARHFGEYRGATYGVGSRFD